MNVLIVDDSALVRNILKDVFSREIDIEVIGEAANGSIAIEKNRELHPDLIIMDINMPIMDGLEATRIIMEDNPVPIIVFSNVLDASNSYKAINFGAVEVLKKPEIDKLNNLEFRSEFLEKLRMISSLKVSLRDDTIGMVSVGEYEETKYKMVVIGASTGGPAAIRTLLRKLPGGLPVAFALVQHLESGFDKSFSQWLGESANMPVELARDMAKVENGKLVVAPTDKHLIIRNNHYYLDDSERILNQKPSVDMLFTTASEAYGENVIGILLTGMGTDGANGCAEIKANNGITLVQDQASSTIFGMPRAAIEKNAASHILPLDDIPMHLLNLLKQRKI